MNYGEDYVFEGEFRNDMANGLGLFYYKGDESACLYTGELQDYQKHGFGNETCIDNEGYQGKAEVYAAHETKGETEGYSYYSGQYRLYYKHGQGTMKHQNGDIYKGGYLYDERHGLGELQGKR